MENNKSRKIDRAGRTPDGKLYMRRGLFTWNELSQYFVAMLAAYGSKVTVGQLVCLKIRQHEQETKKGTQ